MKKLVQVSLVVIVVFVLLLATAAAPSVSVDKMSSDTAQSISPMADATVQSALLPACTRTKVVNCATLNVGWNS
jgi:hypothetical protein